MSELIWFELSPPRDLDLEAVTALVRPLATRPHGGLMGTSPLVVFELWSHGGTISWRLGVDKTQAGILPRQMSAHLPNLGIAPLRDASRPTLTLAADVLMRSLSFPLRTDLAASVSAGLHATLGQLHKHEAAVVQWLVGPSRQRNNRPADFDIAETLGIRPPRPVDATAMRLWRQKATEALFACRGRVGALSNTPARAYVVIRGLGDSLRLVSSAHASLRLGKASSSRARKLSEASQPLTWSCVLSAAELAGLLGFPIDPAGNDNLNLVGGVINLAPAGLLLSEDNATARPGERVLGKSLHPMQRGELVTVPTATSLHHLHVIGPTGSGKSTLLAGLILADVAAGRSVLVVEPKGDLVNDVLARIPSHRHDDVVVIEPGGRSVGINVLAGLRDQAERRADQIVNLLSELHGANLGPRSTDVALHALITASRLHDGTLTDVPVLLTNPAFRRRVLAGVSDPLVLGPWWAWFNSLSDGERGQVVAPILNKIRPLTSRSATRRMLGQAAPRFNLDEFFTGNQRRIVLVNLNRGLLGPETASLLGALLLTQVVAAIGRRTSLAATRRHPVMVTIDEWQDSLRLPGLDFGDALAQFRGLGVGLTLAHQHLDQLTTSQQAAVLANARSRVTFRPATGDAKPLAASLGGGLVGEDLLRLRVYEACCQLHVGGQPTAPFSVRTRPLPPWRVNPDELRESSAQRYGVDGDELDRLLTERWQGGGQPEGPIGSRPRRSS